MYIYLEQHTEAGADVWNHETGTANGTIKQATCHPAVNGAVHNKHSVSNSDETVFKVCYPNCYVQHSYIILRSHVHTLEMIIDIFFQVSVFGLVATVFLVWLCPQYYYIIYSLVSTPLVTQLFYIYTWSI